MSRTEAQRRAWRGLSPNARRILVSHLPDELERDLALRASVRTALENVYGPRVTPASAARVEEGDDDGDKDRWPREDGPAMTYDEIGMELGGLSRTRVMEIINRALRKLRHSCPELYDFVNDAPDGWRADRFGALPADIDGALERARELAGRKEVAT